MDLEPRLGVLIKIGGEGDLSHFLEKLGKGPQARWPQERVAGLRGGHVPLTASAALNLVMDRQPGLLWSPSPINHEATCIFVLNFNRKLASPTWCKCLQS